MTDSEVSVGLPEVVRDALDALPVEIAVLDSDGSVVTTNRAWRSPAGECNGETERTEGVKPKEAIIPSESPAAEEIRRGIESVREGEEWFGTEYTTGNGDRGLVQARAFTRDGERFVAVVRADVTEKRARERAVETFREAVEQAGHAIYITDDGGTIEYVNPAFEELTGHDAEDALGRTPRILKSGEMGEKYYEQLWETLQSGEMWEEEIVNERADGTEYTADQTIAPITDDGEVVKFVAVQQDVTERKRREHDLERYESLITNVPVGVYRATPGMTGEFRAVNPAMVELFDADSQEELVGMPVARVYRHPDKRVVFDRKLDREKRVIDEELRLETLSGETFWGAISAIRREDGDDAYYEGIIQDITERKRATRKLKQREERFRRLFEGHSAPMLLIEPESGSIERANDAAVEFYGYDHEELTAMSTQEINTLADEEVARRRKQADEGAQNFFIFPNELAGGEIRQVAVHSSPIEVDGKTLLFSVVQDVTEREKYRKELERQKERLEILNRVVRHDIRNDMSALIGHAELLGEHVDEDGTDILETVVDRASHATDLTRVARNLVETIQDRESDVEPIEVGPVLREQVETVAESYEEAVVRLDGEVPPVAVEANEMLGEVFRNVLTNAIQHNDTETPAVTVTTDADDDSVTVRITDNGPGVPDDRKEEIFGKGNKGIDSPGSGLGLYLVHSLLDQFGGDVWVEDSEQGGAAFVLTLPRATGDGRSD